MIRKWIKGIVKEALSFEWEQEVEYLGRTGLQVGKQSMGSY